MIFIFLIFSTLSFLFVSILSQNADPSLYLISIVPFILSYCVGYVISELYVNKEIDLAECLRLTCAISTFFCILHIVASIESYGFLEAFAFRGEDSIFGFFSIYQKLVYYPTILSCIFIISLFQKNKVYSAIILVDILIIGSRESVLISSIGLLSYIQYLYKSGEYYRALIYTCGAAFVVIVLVFSSSFWLGMLSESVLINKFISIAHSGDISAGRLSAINKVFSETGEDLNIFWGTGYSMIVGDFRTPHNQFLEVFLRGGLISTVVFLLVIIHSVSNGVKAAMHSDYKDGSTYSLLIVMCVIILISFNVNTPLRAPFSGILFGTILGFFFNTKLRKNI
ncbi:hypothetical protein [Endozoicomonas sp. ISHI1]|uniref:hypothetical protein n=1 Tax=Endozoicomonas sp. ISHI1 TaxID=2825882 RepID=UPI00214863AD|nr:hypothetical protein [Endozoicomonas sp. ISHI1]